MAIADTISSMYENVGEVYDTITNVDVNTGKNLFDKSTITENTYIEENGNTGSSQVTNLSDYIGVKPNTSYTLSYDYSTLLNSNQRNIIYYDENKTYISGLIYLPTNKTNTITTPNNAKYIRFSYDKNCYSIMLNEGSTSLPYEPYTDSPTYKNIENIPKVIRNSYLEIMNNGTDEIWNNWEKVTGSGTDISLSPTLEAPMKNVLNGNTYQFTTTGKNVWDLGSLSGTTQAGVTLKQDIDGGFLLNGTSTGVGRFKIALNTDINEAITLYLKSPNNSGDVMISLRNTDDIQAISMRNDNTLKVYSYTPTAPIRYIELIQLTSGVQYTNYKIYPMIVKGSYTSSTIGDYEPYTNGASPNPDYPQDIHVVSGDNSINVCGKNLLKPYQLSGSHTANGLTATMQSNGTMLVNGTATGNTWIEFVKTFGNTSETTKILYPLDTTKTYIQSSTVISGTISGTANFSIQVNTNVNSSTSVGATRQITGANGVYRAWLYIRNGAVLTNAVIGFQLEEGTTASPYEANQGNTYNIDLPVENLFDKYKEKDNFFYNSSGTTTVSSGNYFINQEIPLNNTYTISYSNRVNGGGIYSFIRFVEYGANDSFIKRTQLENNNSSITLDTNTKKVIISVDAGPNAYFEDLQIEKGSKANSYTPYGTTPIELCKIGNYEDKIFKAIKGNEIYDSLSNEEKNTLDYGKWYLRKNIGKVVLDGSESGGRILDNNQRIAYNSVANPKLADVFIDTPDSVSNLTPSLSTHFSPTMQGRITTTNNSFGFSQWGGQKYIYISAIYDNIEDFKTWLSTHNTIVYYVLATPTYTEITDSTLLSQLEIVKRSYDGQTNISQESNDKPFILDATALKQLTQ